MRTTRQDKLFRGDTDEWTDWDSIEDQDLWIGPLQRPRQRTGRKSIPPVTR